MRKDSSCGSLRTLGLLLVLSPVVAGCIVYPSRQKHILAPGGPGAFSAIKQTLKAKPATRDLIQKSLGYLDTGVSSSTFFWGRWVRESQLNFVAIGAPGAGGGSIGGSGGGHPVVENLLIEFDEDGHALHWNIVDDDELLKKMGPILRRTQTSGGQSPQVPSPCVFRWDQLTLLKTNPPNGRVRPQDYKLVRLQFFTAPDKKKPVCAVDASTESALGIFNHLISTGQGSLLK